MEDWLIWLLVGLGVVAVGAGIYFFFMRGNGGGGPTQPSDGAGFNAQLQTFKDKNLSALLQYLTTLNTGFNLVPGTGTGNYTLYSAEHIINSAVTEYYKVDPAQIANLQDGISNPVNTDIQNNDPKIDSIKINGSSIEIAVVIIAAGSGLLSFTFTNTLEIGIQRVVIQPPANPIDNADLNTQLQTFKGQTLSTLAQYLTNLNQNFSLAPIVGTANYTLYSQAHVASAPAQTYYYAKPASIDLLTSATVSPKITSLTMTLSPDPVAPYVSIYIKAVQPTFDVSVLIIAKPKQISVPTDNADLNTQLQTFKGESLSTLAQYLTSINANFGLAPTAGTTNYTIYSQAHMTNASTQSYCALKSTDVAALPATGSSAKVTNIALNPPAADQSLSLTITCDQAPLTSTIHIVDLFAQKQDGILFINQCATFQGKSISTFLQYLSKLNDTCRIALAPNSTNYTIYSQDHLAQLAIPVSYIANPGDISYLRNLVIRRQQDDNIKAIILDSDHNLNISFYETFMGPTLSDKLIRLVCAPADGADLNAQLQTFNNQNSSLLAGYFTALNAHFGLVPVANSTSYTIHSKAHMASAPTQTYYYAAPTDLIFLAYPYSLPATKTSAITMVPASATQNNPYVSIATDSPTLQVNILPIPNLPKPADGADFNTQLQNFKGQNHASLFNYLDNQLAQGGFGLLPTADSKGYTIYSSSEMMSGPKTQIYYSARFVRITPRGKTMATTLIQNLELTDSEFYIMPDQIQASTIINDIGLINPGSYSDSYIRITYPDQSIGTITNSDTYLDLPLTDLIDIGPKSEESLHARVDSYLYRPAWVLADDYLSHFTDARSWSFGLIPTTSTDYTVRAVFDEMKDLHCISKLDVQRMQNLDASIKIVQIRYTASAITLTLDKAPNTITLNIFKAPQDRDYLKTVIQTFVNGPVSSLYNYCAILNSRHSLDVDSYTDGIYMIVPQWPMGKRFQLNQADLDAVGALDPSLIIQSATVTSTEMTLTYDKAPNTSVIHIS